MSYILDIFLFFSCISGSWAGCGSRFMPFFPQKKVARERERERERKEDFQLPFQEDFGVGWPGQPEEAAALLWRWWHRDGLPLRRMAVVAAGAMGGSWRVWLRWFWRWREWPQISINGNLSMKRSDHDWSLLINVYWFKTATINHDARSSSLLFRQTHVILYGCVGHHWHGVIIRAHSHGAIR